MGLRRLLRIAAVPIILLAALDDVHRARKRERGAPPRKSPEQVAEETAFWARRLS